MVINDNRLAKNFSGNVVLAADIKGLIFYL